MRVIWQLLVPPWLFAVSCLSSAGPSQVALGAHEAESSWSRTTAVLFLDCTNAIVDGVRTSDESRDFLAALQRLEKKAQASDALVIYSWLGLRPGRPELAGPMKEIVKGIEANLTIGANATHLIPELSPRLDDPHVRKIRYGATHATDLLVLLRSHRITDVVLAGIRTSGVVLSTAYTLFDHDFYVHVARNATIETPLSSQSHALQDAILDGIMPKLKATVFTI